MNNFFYSSSFSVVLDWKSKVSWVPLTQEGLTTKLYSFSIH